MSWAWHLSILSLCRSGWSLRLLLQHDVCAFAEALLVINEHTLVFVALTSWGVPQFVACARDKPGLLAPFALHIPHQFHKKTPKKVQNAKEKEKTKRERAERIAHEGTNAASCVLKVWLFCSCGHWRWGCCQHALVAAGLLGVACAHLDHNTAGW